MSNVDDSVDPQKLGSYVAAITDSEILEDLSHLLELKVVTGALASTEQGSAYKLPLKALTNMLVALGVYRDELASRAFDADRDEDSGYTMLGEYYKCVKAVRSMSRYLDRVVPIISMDFTGKYSELSQHKTSLQFKQDSIGN